MEGVPAEQTPWTDFTICHTSPVRFQKHQTVWKKGAKLKPTFSSSTLDENEESFNHPNFNFMDCFTGPPLFSAVTDWVLFFSSSSFFPVRVQRSSPSCPDIILLCCISSLFFEEKQTLLKRTPPLAEKNTLKRQKEKKTLMNNTHLLCLNNVLVCWCSKTIMLYWKRHWKQSVTVQKQ